MWSLEASINFAKNKGMPKESYENATSPVEIYDYYWRIWRSIEIENKKKGEKK